MGFKGLKLLIVDDAMWSAITLEAADGGLEHQSLARRLGTGVFFVKSFPTAAVRERVEELLHETTTHDPV